MMKFDEGETGIGDGAVVMVLVAEDADAGGEFHLGVVGIGDVLQQEYFCGQRRERFDFAWLFRFVAGYNPAVTGVVAANAFGIAELHALFQGPAEEEIVFGKKFVERGRVFFEFRVIEIGRQRIEENFVALGFDQQPGHRGDFTGGPVKIAGEARKDGDGEFGFLDDFFNGHLERDVRPGFFFRLLVGPGDGAAVEPPGAGRKREEEIG